MKRFLSLAALALCVPTFAQAQTLSNCGPRADVIAQLGERYGESRQAIGLAANEALVEVFANTQSGSWTIIATLATGLTCLIASGESYEAVDEPLKSGDRL